MNLLEVTDLTVRRNATFCLDVPTLQVPAGRIICITGPNGSGKTTLIETLIGLIRPATGNVHIAGVPVSGDIRATKAVLGFVPDDENWLIKGLSAREYFQLLMQVYRQAGANSDVKKQTSELAQQLRFTAFDQLLEQLSHGNKKKVQLIAALMHQPKVLILDELRNGLDPLAIIEAERLVRSLAARGTSIIATTHDLWWAQRIADEIMLLLDGKPVVQQPRDVLLEEYGSLEELFLKTVNDTVSNEPL